MLNRLKLAVGLFTCFCLASCAAFQSADEKVAALRAQAARAVQSREYARAQGLFQDAIEASRRSNNLLQTSILLKECGEFHLANGQLFQSEQNLRDAVAMFQHLRQEKDASSDRALQLNYTQSVVDLARALKDEGKLAESRKLYEQVIAANDRTASGYVTAIDVSQEYKDVLKRLGESDAVNRIEASDGGALAKQAWRERFDERKEGMFAYVEGGNRNPAKAFARALASDALRFADLAKHFGADDPSHFDALVLAGSAQFCAGEKAKADITLKDALTELPKIPPDKLEESECVWQCYYYLMLVAYEKGSYEEAVEYGQRAREYCLRVNLESMNELESTRLYRTDKIMLDSLKHCGDIRIARPVEREFHELEQRRAGQKLH